MESGKIEFPFLFHKWACWMDDRSICRFTPEIFLQIVVISTPYGHVRFGGIKSKLSFGEMAEWLIAPVLKTGIVLNKELSRVRIPLSPFFAH